MSDAVAPASGANQTRLWDVLFRPASLEQVNQRNVIVDAVGVGITAGVGSFLSVFLVRLGASSFLVGLLTAMPALTGMALAMPVGEFLSRRPNIVPWFARSRFAVLSCYMLTGLVPFFVHSRQPEAIIAIWALATLPQNLVSVAFTVVMGGVAGPRGRFTLMSRRWSILGLANSLTVVIVGQILNLFNFPLNYQVVFIGSAIGALISVIFSSSIRLPLTVPSSAVHESLVQTLRKRGSTLRANKPFVRFIVSQFVFRSGMALAVPLFPIYWVRNIHASDQAISAINSTQTFVMMIAYFVWARVSQRKGERWVLLVAALGVSFYPLLTALTQRVEPLVAWAALGGLFTAGIDLVFFDVVLSTCPADQQATYLGIYQTTVYAANFLAPLAGTTLTDTVGIIPALIAATALRLVGFGLLTVLGVGRE
ncbi:MAG: MFS transporter [Chloroflexi bacterium]|nr:MFS transporter [Chloroflexota bacterium]